MSKKKFGNFADRDSSSALYGVDVSAKKVLLGQVVVDDRLQVRVDGLDTGTVVSYAATLENGETLPPVDVFRIEDKFILAAGFHRVAAHWQAGKDTIMVHIHEGDWDDAMQFAEEDNLANALALNNRDKKNIFMNRLYRGHEWRELSNRAIGGKLGVHHDTVGNWRKEYEETTGDVVQTRRTADGRFIDISNIQESNAERVVEDEPEPVADTQSYEPFPPEHDGGYFMDTDEPYDLVGVPDDIRDLHDDDVPPLVENRDPDEPKHLTAYLRDADKYWSLDDIIKDPTKRLQAKVAIAVRVGQVTEQEANNMKILEYSNDVRDTRLWVWNRHGQRELRGGPIQRPVDRVDPDLVRETRERITSNNAQYLRDDGKPVNTKSYLYATELMGKILDAVTNIEQQIKRLMEVNSATTLVERGADDMALVAHRLRQAHNTMYNGHDHARYLADRIEWMAKGNDWDDFDA